MARSPVFPEHCGDAKLAMPPKLLRLQPLLETYDLHWAWAYFPEP